MLIGTHVLGRLSLTKDFRPSAPKTLITSIVKIIKKHGMTPVGEPGLYLFDQFAFTGFVMLQESHVSLHTWYERGYIDLDVYVCNVTRDNSAAAEKIFDDIASLFKATAANKEIISR